ncbi:MAG: PEGA domain-containing protein [Deltaproteobacteria bacterium]|nr:PEGA domain-containing protein [Kofleriaceae bacterium]
MALPTDVDYQEALQNPRVSFLDVELQNGRPEVQSAALPFPKARSGNFAVAFRMNCASRSWAVKCFTRALQPDLQERYTAISTHLASARLPYSVGFTFLPKGIRVRNEVFPILKMEWIDGESLSRNIERNLGNQAALFGLASRWLEMLRALQAANICHGDLQHGNVLVVGGELRLIDYDGMYVPTLAGRRSHERGHENYQHPHRESEFGPGLDNFSAWVVFVSLLAVAYEPTLWRNHRGGDECILFRKTDFANPDRSQLLAALLASREQRVRSLASLFRTLLYLPPQQVPSLDGQFLPTAPTRSVPVGQALPSWVSEHRPSDSPGAVPPAVGQPSNELEVGDAGGLWVLDHALHTPAEALAFVRPPTLERLVAIATVMLTALVALAVARGSPMSLLAIVPSLMVGNVALWLVRFGSEGVRAARKRKAQELAEVQAEFDSVEAKLREFLQEQRLAEVAGGKVESDLHKAMRQVDARVAAELEPPRAACRREMERIRIAREKISKSQLVGLQQIQSTTGANLSRVKRDLADLALKESSEMAAVLSAAQKHHVASALSAASIDHADIPGIKEGLKERLKAAGIYSAADADRILYYKVEGIGDKKSAALLSWRSAVDARARATAPTVLPTHHIRVIRSKYAKQQSDLETTLALLDDQNAKEVAAVQGEVARLQQALASEEVAAREKLHREEHVIQEHHGAERARVASELTRVGVATRKQITEIDARAQETRKAAFGTIWKRERALREYAHYDAVSFRRFAERSVPPALRIVAGLTAGAAFAAGLIAGLQPTGGSRAVAPSVVSPAIPDAAPVEKPAPAEPASAPADVVVDSSPQAALVYEGRTKLGKTPLTIQVMQGAQRTLSIRKKGYKTVSITIGDQPNVTVSLQKARRGDRTARSGGDAPADSPSNPSNVDTGPFTEAE